MPRYFEDYRVGDEAVSPGRTIFEADVVNFFYLSGDQNEAHSNLEVAHQIGLKGPSVQWNLVFALVAGLLMRSGFYTGDGPLGGPVSTRPIGPQAQVPEGPKLAEGTAGSGPGDGTGVGYHGFQFNNLRPVVVGDTIWCVVRVGALRDLGDRGVCRRDVSVYNQRDELIAVGWHEMEVAKRIR
jgi:acyl dehydratase